MLPMQGTWVQSLVGELRSHLLHGVGKKKKKSSLNISWYLEIEVRLAAARMMTLAAVQGRGAGEQGVVWQTTASHCVG